MNKTTQIGFLLLVLASLLGGCSKPEVAPAVAPQDQTAAQASAAQAAQKNMAASEATRKAEAAEAARRAAQPQPKSQ